MANTITTNEANKVYSPFKTAICDYLREFVRKDPSFIAKIKDPSKNIDKCLDYIIGEVKESGRQGFADDEIFSLAVHYYDESNENLKEHQHTESIKVVVNRDMPFTEEEKQKARKEAYERMVADEQRRLEAKNKPTTSTTTATTKKAEKKDDGMYQLDLFGEGTL